MPPPLDHEMAFDDDDGMPPLVDNPLPPMTFTFAADLPPISYTSYDFAPPEYPPEAPAIDMNMYSPQETTVLDLPRASHAKKRDASYIPRPPNAFILFRSSFIRGGHIPGEIEGNHSALSKIIGKCWKALPREERQVWEAKAIVALAEHRKKYPDWRFKPAANALAKVKDGPRKRGNRKGRGQSEKEERSREKRCAKIADLLVAGKTGSDLAAAVEQYDCETGRGRRPKDEGASASVGEGVGAGAGALASVELPHVLGEGTGCGGPAVAEGVNDNVKASPVVGLPVPSASALTVATDGLDVKPLAIRSAVDGRFKVPLTAMFKRSSSAPAPRARTPSGELPAFLSHRRDSFSAAPSSFSRATSFNASGATREEMAEVGFGSAAAPCKGVGHAFADSVSSIQSFSADAAAPLALPRNAVDGVTDRVLDSFGFAGSTYSSPSLPAFDFDADGHSSPIQSPIDTPLVFGWGQESDVGSPTSISDMMSEAYAPAPSPSSYSSLEGWAGSPLPKPAVSPINSPLPRVCHYVDSPSVMKKAFEAAACAVYDWSVERLGHEDDAHGHGHGHGLPVALGSAHAFYPWPSDVDAAYAFPAVQLQCRQDDF
ncbi:transcription factor [Ganoderma sinense ZZ0214-1]|uniref:Transcription factor n=1 Tax=Ganoderma sinense ZZ0214-1 TaxID=1077348 RepID=A0A2G8RNA7_9APHY|nr:transcription factor [Ganoderma sinense ZZ0214-1]